MAKKTTWKEKREYKKLCRMLAEEELAAERKERQELRMLSKETGRDYFRYPDGRLGYFTSRGGMGVDLNDPATSRIYVNEMRRIYDKFDLKNGKLVVRSDYQEETIVKEPTWRKAIDYKPTKSGEYKCMTETGLFKKTVQEQGVKYHTFGVTGKWLTEPTTRVVYWLEP